MKNLSLVNFKKSIYDYVSIEKGKLYWKKKWKISNQMECEIDWEVFNKTNRLVSQE